MIKEVHYTVKKTARYYQLGEINHTTKTIWFVLHGYRQLAKYFIKQFQIIENGENVVIAPEGLHRFYLNGYSGRVGASWMTSEDRIIDIEDYVHFLDDLYSNLKIDSTVKINVVGFSQGGATASRWAGFGKSRIDNLILWGGIFPADMKFDKGKIKKPITFLVGTEDEFITEEKLMEYEIQLKKQGVEYNLVKYYGSHKIYNEPLLNLKNL